MCVHVCVCVCVCLVKALHGLCVTLESAALATTKDGALELNPSQLACHTRASKLGMPCAY